jgi:hypothetical protein
LTNEQWAIRETAEDIIDFLHAVQRTVVPDIPEASQILATVDARLQAYGDAQEEAHLAPVTQQFVTEPADIRAVVDCSPSATTVFERARAGADTFTAELDVGEARRVRSAAEAELEAQQETIAVEVPELARDDAAAMAQAMRDAWARLNQARRRGALPETWRRLREQLTDYFIREQQAEEIWEAWEDGAWRE